MAVISWFANLLEVHQLYIFLPMRTTHRETIYIFIEEPSPQDSFYKFLYFVLCLYCIIINDCPNYTDHMDFPGCTIISFLYGTSYYLTKTYSLSCLRLKNQLFAFDNSTANKNLCRRFKLRASTFVSWIILSGLTCRFCVICTWSNLSAAPPIFFLIR